MKKAQLKKKKKKKKLFIKLSKFDSRRLVLHICYPVFMFIVDRHGFLDFNIDTTRMISMSFPITHKTCFPNILVVYNYFRF